MAKTFLSLAEAAKKWHISASRLQQACEEGSIEDAARLSGQWIIPSEAPRPKIKQAPKGAAPTAQYTDAMARTVTARTPVQAAVIRAVSSGQNLGFVTEHTIGKTTYIVSSIFPRQGRTLSEAFYQYLLHALQMDGQLTQFPDRDAQTKEDAFMKNLRRRDPVFTTTREEKMEAVRAKLEEYGFTAEEIEILMAKIEEDYEEPIF